MSLVFSAIVPHPPLLIPSIGREHAKELDKTRSSYEKISALLALSGAETIVIISPHLSAFPETFLINYSPAYETHFIEFGDFSESREYAPDHQLIEAIRNRALEEEQKINLVNEVHLDYGSGVPLYFLPERGRKIQIVVVSPTAGDAKAQFAFGRIVKDAVLNSSKKIAVICSADLSHRHTSESAFGFSAKAKVFDDMIVANLSAGSASPILRIDESLANEAHACGFRPIAMMLGVMDKIDCRPELLSYEAPFGVGYATMAFHLK
jgi:MEMO1 family protein